MKIMTLAKLAALGGAVFYVKKQGGFKPAFEKLKESMKGLADQAKPAVESALSGASSLKSETGSDIGTGIGSSPRTGSTFGNKTNY